MLAVGVLHHVHAGEVQAVDGGNGFDAQFAGFGIGGDFLAGSFFLTQRREPLNCCLCCVKLLAKTARAQDTNGSKSMIITTITFCFAASAAAKLMKI